jgi:beta-galactosidase/beta-glucuronidase
MTDFDHPRPLFRRERWVSLDGVWEFGAGAHAKFDRRIRVPFCPQSALSGLGDPDPGDVVWYRRRFDAPACARLLLHFGAVDYRATVWVNGDEMAAHEGGHTPFTLDISRVAGRPGNELVVRAEDPLADRTIPRGKQHWTANPERIFYTATTGIWQTVWLEPLPERFIESIRVVPDLDAASVAVDCAADGEVGVRVTFDGREVGRGHGSGVIQLSEVHPWSPERPDLYELRLELGELDRVGSYFGLRKVEARQGRFWLNGEPYVQRLVLDQGYFPGGLMTAPSDADLKRDVELAKRLGFNGARKHQKIEDPRWLGWADRLGLLVWAEMPSFRQDSLEARRRYTAEWTEAVRAQRDHPSVVTWVPMNESDGLAPGFAPFLDSLHALTRQLDPSRPIVSNDGWEHATTDVCTLHDYDGARALARRYRDLDSTLDSAVRAHPPYLPGYGYRDEPVIVSEFGGVALKGDGGWHYSEADGPAGLLDAYRGMVEALMDPGPVEGFCYTQLADVQQERNGLLTAERRPKVDPERVRQITRTPKRR